MKKRTKILFTLFIACLIGGLITLSLVIGGYLYLPNYINDNLLPTISKKLGVVIKGDIHSIEKEETHISNLSIGELTIESATLSYDAKELYSTHHIKTLTLNGMHLDLNSNDQNIINPLIIAIFDKNKLESIAKGFQIKTIFLKNVSISIYTKQETLQLNFNGTLTPDQGKFSIINYQGELLFNGVNIPLSGVCDTTKKQIRSCAKLNHISLSKLKIFYKNKIPFELKGTTTTDVNWRYNIDSKQIEDVIIKGKCSQFDILRNGELIAFGTSRNKTISFEIGNWNTFKCSALQTANGGEIRATNGTISTNQEKLTFLGSFNYLPPKSFANITLLPLFPIPCKFNLQLNSGLRMINGEITPRFNKKNRFISYSYQNKNIAFSGDINALTGILTIKNNEFLFFIDVDTQNSNGILKSETFSIKHSKSLLYYTKGKFKINTAMNKLQFKNGVASSLKGEFSVHKNSISKATFTIPELYLSSLQTTFKNISFSRKNKADSGHLKIKNIVYKNRELGELNSTVIKTGNGVSLSGIFTPKESDINISLNGKIEISKGELSSELNYTIPPFNQTNPVELGSIIPSLKGVLFSGTVTGNGKLIYNKKGLKLPLNLKLENSSLKINALHSELKNGSIIFQTNDMLNKDFSSKQEITFSTLILNQFKFSNGKLNVDFSSQKGITFYTGSAHWLGGYVSLQPSLCSWNKENKIKLFCNTVSAKKLIEKFTPIKISEIGNINGPLPLIIDKNKIYLGNTQFHSPAIKPYILRVENLDALVKSARKKAPQSVINQLELTAGALTLFKYKWLAIQFYQKDKKVNCKLSFLGTPKQKLPFFYQNGVLKKTASGEMGFLDEMELSLHFKNIMR